MNSDCFKSLVVKKSVVSVKCESVSVCSLCAKEGVTVKCQFCGSLFCADEKSVCGDVSSLTCRVCNEFKESSQGDLDDIN